MAPNSNQARVYQRLAQKTADHSESTIPAPLDIKELRAWAARWADYLLALETGEIRSEAVGI